MGCHFLLCQHTNIKDIAGQFVSAHGDDAGDDSDDDKDDDNPDEVSIVTRVMVIGMRVTMMKITRTMKLECLDEVYNRILGTPR